jgi:hypothetical protein
MSYELPASDTFDAAVPDQAPLPDTGATPPIIPLPTLFARADREFQIRRPTFPSTEIDDTPREVLDRMPGTPGAFYCNPPVRPTLHRRVLFAGFWAATSGLDPTDLNHLRKAAPRITRSDLTRHITDKYGNLGKFGEHILQRLDTEGSMNWPQSLLDGAEAWPRPPKRHPLKGLLPVTTFNENNPLQALPRWQDICDWYHNRFPLEYHVIETVGEEIVRDGDSPLSDWAEYWNEQVLPYDLPALDKPKSILGDKLITLEGIPEIDSPEELEACLRSPNGAHEAYACIDGLKTVRLLDREGQVASQELTGVERAIINLLFLSELRTGRAVSIGRLAKRSGQTEKKIITRLTSLTNKLNQPDRPRIILSLKYGHFRISPDAIIVDCRAALEEAGTEYTEIPQS